MPSSAAPRRFSPLHRVALWPAWRRLGLGLLPAAGLYMLAPGQWPALLRLLLAWDGFTLTTLAITWAIILRADVAHLRQIATKEDPGRVLSFVAVLGAAVASLLAVVLLLSKADADTHQTARVVAGAVGVLTAWLLVHTLFTLRYAHLYYAADGKRAEGGLEFPGNEKEPDYLDFAYFSFVIGMTAQTADVGVSDRLIRRLALVHGLLSFGFNTAVVALTINGLASVL
ncbi:DUF1345 domain-containing protein [Hymenobacter pini]|uniref:DUF1345 domain-containing protein n=1 Tax=Hymenobacter pini TaxID=2880879 RepID=UPI001CF3FDE2|nr:DUF1345 domain-containing protein [Hymenobacter pini]MCA8832050.1 DUF1345 domain-containing protein [Hymenobacter pini]